MNPRPSPPEFKALVSKLTGKDKAVELARDPDPTKKAALDALIRDGGQA
jgi:hypothetical protein